MSSSSIEDELVLAKTSSSSRRQARPREDELVLAKMSSSSIEDELVFAKMSSSSIEDELVLDFVKINF